MDYSQTRMAALAALQRAPKTQWEGFVRLVSQLAFELGFVTDPAGLGRQPTELLSAEDKEQLREVFWALFIEGVVILGMDRNNNAWPFFCVTEYGTRVIAAGEVLPHDPDGYLNRLEADCPGFDPISRIYVSESLQCFLRGNYLGAAVMLGVASEKLFLDLLDAFKQSLPPDVQKKLEDATNNRSVARQWAEFRKRFSSALGQLPNDLQDEIDTLLDGVFTLIRATRNQSGHPTGRLVDRDTMFAHLQLFRTYARRVCGLTRFYRERPSPPPA